MSKRSRGYCWESDVVKLLQDDNWWAVRIGGTTTTMPDVSANKGSTVLAAECKSAQTNTAPVPGEQIQRCVDWCNNWGKYTNQIILLAFRFVKTGTKGMGNLREKREYLKVWDFDRKITNISCNYDGEIFSEKKKIQLEDFQ